MMDFDYNVDSSNYSSFSPTDTGTGTGREATAPSSNVQSGPTEEYAAIQKNPTRNVPHQTAATGEEFAVSTKPGKKPQGPTEEYAQTNKSKTSGQQGVGEAIIILVLDQIKH